MNKELLLRYAQERIGNIEDLRLIEQVIEITLTALGNYYLRNYEIKDFMEHLYKARLGGGK